MITPRFNVRFAFVIAGLTCGVLNTNASRAQTVEVQTPADPPLRVFPRDPLFAPLTADPRWPRFEMGYSYFFGDPQFGHSGLADAGANIAILQKKRPTRGSWELGMQGGIFSMFNFEAPSNDLVNADYLAGLTFVYAYHRFSLLTRFIHQSSHLGDEYLLDNMVQRINLSFEEINVLGSYDPLHWLRIYGGAAVIVRREPSSLDRWSLQGGVEARPITFSTKHRLQLLFALDLRAWQQNDWVPDLSLAAGPSLDPGDGASYRVDFLIKYYYGHSRNGQFFFTERIQTLGPSIQVYF